MGMVPFLQNCGFLNLSTWPSLSCGFTGLAFGRSSLLSFASGIAARFGALANF